MNDFRYAIGICAKVKYDELEGKLERNSSQVRSSDAQMLLRRCLSGVEQPGKRSLEGSKKWRVETFLNGNLLNGMEYECLISYERLILGQEPM